jgi:predicted ATPase
MEIHTEAGSITYLPRRICWRLLAQVAMGGGAGILRSTVLDTLDFEGTNTKAETTLRVALTSLRKALGEDIIASDEGRLRLLVPCDVAEFEQALRSIRLKGNAEKREEALSRALLLYEGELLPALNDSWTTGQRERLRLEAEWIKAERGAEEERKMGGFPLIGREKEVATLKSLLQRSRLVSLVGIGGIGKSHLADEAVKSEPHVTKVNLASTTRVPLLPEALRRALDLPEAGDIVAGLTQDKRRVLLLDNVEHLVGSELNEYLTHLLDESKEEGLRILATSRRVLGCKGEKHVSLGALACPPEKRGEGWNATPDAILAFPATQLFYEQARRSKSDFHLTKRNADSIASLCRRVGGSPLGVLLLASRVSRFELMALENDPLPNLLKANGGFLGDRARHGNLEEVIAWSTQQLPSDLGVLLTNCAIFQGSFGLEAAQAVCGATPESLENLVSESLLEVAQTDDKERRFRLHETVRAYLENLVDRAANGSTANERLVRYYVGLAERLAPDLRKRRGKVLLDHLTQEHENLRVALAVARPEDAVRLAIALNTFWRVRGWIQEGIKELERLQGLLGTRFPMDARLVLGELIYFLGDQTKAHSVMEEALKLAQQSRDVEQIARTERLLATVLHSVDSLGYGKRVQALIKTSLAYSEPRNDLKGMASCYNMLAVSTRDEGDLDGAEKLHQKSLECYQKLDDVPGEATLLANLAKISQRRYYAIPPPVGSIGIAHLRKVDYLYKQSRALFVDYGAIQSVAVVDGWRAGPIHDIYGKKACIELQLSAISVLYAYGERMFLVETIDSLICTYIPDLAEKATGNKQQQLHVKYITLRSAVDHYREGRAAHSPTNLKAILVKSFKGRISSDAAFEAAWATGQKMTLKQLVTEVKKIKV